MDYFSDDSERTLTANSPYNSDSDDSTIPYDDIDAQENSSYQQTSMYGREIKTCRPLDYEDIWSLQPVTMGNYELYELSMNITSTTNSLKRHSQTCT